MYQVPMCALFRVVKRTIAAVALLAVTVAGCGGSSHIGETDAWSDCITYAATHHGATSFDYMDSLLTKRTWGYDVAVHYSSLDRHRIGLCEVTNKGRVINWLGP